MTDTTTSDSIPDVNISELTIESLTTLLKSHAHLALVVEDAADVHAFEYDPDDDRVVFYAHGSMGYDSDGTESAFDALLEAINEPDPDGVWFQDERAPTSPAEVNTRV